MLRTPAIVINISIKISPFVTNARASSWRVAIWPFLKRFARKNTVGPFGHFPAFFNVEENSIFSYLISVVILNNL
jgi:hypothetical protein